MGDVRFALVLAKRFRIRSAHVFEMNSDWFGILCIVIPYRFAICFHPSLLTHGYDAPFVS